MIEEDDIDTLLKVITSEEDDYVRIYALDILKNHSQRRTAVPTLISLLSDKNTEIRIKALEVLARINSKEAIEAILSIIDSFDWRVRKAAVRALGEQENVKVIEHIIPRLFDDNWEVRNEAAIILDFYHYLPSSLEERTAYLVAKEQWKLLANDEEVSLPILLNFLDDKEPEIRRNILWVLGERKISTEEVCEKLFHILTEDDVYDIRERAAEALSKIGTDQSFHFLELASKSDKWFVRKCVASSLKFFSDKVIALKLLSILSEDENIYVRKAAKESEKVLTSI